MNYTLCTILAILTIANALQLSRTREDSLLKIRDMSKCKYQIEAVGCFMDKRDNRIQPDQILNSRDKTSIAFKAPMLQWKNYNRWLANFICECATILMDKKKGNVESDYIGLQYYGECWANLKKRMSEEDINKYGKAVSCIDGDYQVYSPSHKKCQVYMGQTSSSFIYKVSKRPTDADDCPYYTKRGCFKDTAPRNRRGDKPLETYATNERDKTASNWNGKLINWNKWGDGYLNGLICRCAKKAKATNKRFFGIQFYGECWTGNDESTINKHGPADTCIDEKFNATCNKNSDSLCQPKLCAGKGLTNMVYEMHQGPLACLKNPCPSTHSKCTPNGLEKHDCELDFNSQYAKNLFKKFGYGKNTKPAYKIIGKGEYHE